LADLPPRLVEERGETGFAGLQDLGRFLERESLDRGQQKRLARPRLHVGQLQLRSTFPMISGRAGLEVEADRFPQPAQQPVELDAEVAAPALDLGRVGNDCFEEWLVISVNNLLTSGERPPEASKIRQVRTDYFCKSHSNLLA